MEKFYFVMPAYNESANIETTIKQWYPVVERINGMENCQAVLAIANDGSKDDTYEVMSPNLMVAMGKPCFTSTATPSPTAPTTYSRLTPTVKPTQRSSGRCSNTATTMTSR